SADSRSRRRRARQEVGANLEALQQLACCMALFKAGDEIGVLVGLEAPAAQGRGNGQADSQAGLARGGKLKSKSWNVLTAGSRLDLTAAWRRRSFRTSIWAESS